MAPQNGKEIVTDSNETKEKIVPVGMSGSDSNADAVQMIGGTNVGGSGGSGTGSRNSAVTTLASNGAQSQNNIQSNTNGVAGGTANINNNNQNSGINQRIERNHNESEEEESTEGPSPVGATPRGGVWGVYDPPVARGGGAGSPSAMDNMSEVSSQPPAPPGLPRSKSRTDMMAGPGGSNPSALTGSNSNLAASGRISNQLSFWKARCITFYRNGDPFFNGLEFRFKPGRDISNLERLLDKISTRMDLPRGARFIFSMDGDRKYSLDELEDGASYVVSSFKTFKVSVCLSIFFSISCF